MSTAPESMRLLSLEIRSEHDVVLCRQRARQVSEGLGFDAQDQVRIATAVSEIARNAQQYGKGGRVDFSVRTGRAAERKRATHPQSLMICIRDEGPGISNVEEVLEGRVASATGLGVGITGTRRLMDDAQFVSTAEGTTVTLVKHLPATSPQLSAAKIQEVVDQLTKARPASAIEEVLSQNQELIRLMDDLQNRKQDIENANRELEETNSGVLALYDELETLHRVGMMLATKVDLTELIQALIDATTDLTGAQWGAFFFNHEPGKPYRLQATSGPRQALLESYSGEVKSATPDEFGPQRVINAGDVSGEGALASMPDWLVELQGVTRFKSCLAVPVIDAEEAMIGAIVLGSGEQSAFSERGERIVASIAVQVVVAVEKVRLIDRVKATSSAKDRFLAMLSHELRTPLNPVMAIVSSLNDNPELPEAFRDDIRVVLRNIQLETRIIDDLLDFHRLINGKFVLVHKPVDVHAMVHNAVQICRAEITEKRHGIVLDLKATRATVSGEAARIQQVLWNLLKNAVKFTPKGGTITIHTENADGKLIVEIIDNGRGMSAAAIANVFAPFEQGDGKVSAEFGGLGLGLTIAQAFVEKHGGIISAHSEGEGRGSRIAVTLPLLDVEAKGAQNAPTAPAVADPAARQAAVHILLVDDHADTLSALSRLLRVSGHAVTTAATCAEALAAFSSEIGLIVSDLGLPDESGNELIGMIRKTSQVPAIAMSGYGMEADVAASRAAGFQVHLTKPVDVSQLLATIRTLTGGEG